MILWMVVQTAWAGPQLRHTQGIQGMELTGGKTALGYCVSGAYSAYLGRHCYWKLAVGGTWHRQTQVSYQAFQIMPAFGANLIEGGKSFYINLLLGTAATYESHKQRGDTHEGWNLVLQLGPELELFLSHNFAMLASLLPSYYCLKNPYGRWGYEGRLGLKVTF